MASEIHTELIEIERHKKETISILSSLQSGKLHPSIMGKQVLTEIYKKLSSKLKCRHLD